MSNWQAITLGAAFNALNQGKQVERDLLNKKAQEINALIAQLNSEIADVSSALGVTNQTLQSLLVSGFHFLLLEPGEGGIVTRIENAGNQPPAIGQIWSTGVVIAAQAPSLAQITNNYVALKNVIDIGNQANL